MRTFRELNEAAKKIGSVSNKETLKEALPIIVETAERIKYMTGTLSQIGKVLGDLNEKVSKYALEHPSIFTEGLVTDGKGVLHGDLVLDGTGYHFASGYAGPKRVDGDAMTQGFLGALPEEWVKMKLVLDTTGINRLNVSTEQLKEAGLFRPVKNEWSLKNAAALDDVDE